MTAGHEDDDAARDPDANSGPASGGGAEVPDQALVSALEFAVGIAAAGARQRPPMAFPPALKPYLRLQRLSGPALAGARRALEQDPAFRRRLGQVAVPDLVDDVGRLWLERPDGWEEQATALLAARRVEGERADAATALRKAERRRDAAEQAARRALAEVAALRAELDRQRQLAADATAEAEALRDRVEQLRAEVAQGERRLSRAAARLDSSEGREGQLQAQLDEALDRAASAEQVRDQVLADRAGGEAAGAAVLAGAAALQGELDQIAGRAAALGEELRRVAGALGRLEPRPDRAPDGPPPADDGPRRPRGGRRRGRSRTAVALPGGVYGSTREAAEFLLRHPGVLVLVDGYNVAKLGWPDLALDDQRERCVAACEDLARRFGTDLVVAFDGRAVTGASTSQRRLVRVRFSPEGVSADDVIREEVDGLGPEVPVVVVTNDQAIVRDVRAAGANTLASEQLLDVALR